MTEKYPKLKIAFSPACCIDKPTQFSNSNNYIQQFPQE